MLLLACRRHSLALNLHDYGGLLLQPEFYMAHGAPAFEL